MSARLIAFTTVPLVLAALLVPATTASAYRTSYPASHETLGTMGKYVSHPKGWHIGTDPGIGSTKFTSYCKSKDTWGVLTDPNGYEILADGSYGTRAFVMYDAANGRIRPANVDENGKLVPAGRVDLCKG